MFAWIYYFGWILCRKYRLELVNYRTRAQYCHVYFCEATQGWILKAIAIKSHFPLDCLHHAWA